MKKSLSVTLFSALAAALFAAAAFALLSGAFAQIDAGEALTREEALEQAPDILITDGEYALMRGLLEDAAAQGALSGEGVRVLDAGARAASFLPEGAVYVETAAYRDAVVVTYESGNNRVYLTIHMDGAVLKSVAVRDGTGEMRALIDNTDNATFVENAS